MAVDEVLAPADEPMQDQARADRAGQAAEERTGNTSQVPDTAKAKSQVPVWREGLDRLVLSVDCPRILHVLADRCRLGQGPLTCQEMAALFGMDVVPAPASPTSNSPQSGKKPASWRAGP